MVACEVTISSSFLPKYPIVTLVAARSFAIVWVSYWSFGVEISFWVLISSYSILTCSCREVIFWLLLAGVAGFV
jgi:hypothetical protein